jgi:hypothetical protein
MVIDLVRSGGGAFEVVLDGRLLFSKKAVGRHCTIINKYTTIRYSTSDWLLESSYCG